MTRCERASASIVYAPRCSNMRRTTLLPVAILPVKPITYFPGQLLTRTPLFLVECFIYFNVFCEKLQCILPISEPAGLLNSNNVLFPKSSPLFKKIVLIMSISVDALFPCVYDNAASGQLGDRGSALSGPRKVRTP